MGDGGFEATHLNALFQLTSTWPANVLIELPPHINTLKTWLVNRIHRTNENLNRYILNMIFSKVYDRHNECPAWSAMDECKKSNWTWMVDHCPRSCDVPCKWQFSYRKKLYFITWENKVWNLVKNDICRQEISNILHFSRVAMSWHFWQYLGMLGNSGKKCTVINIYRIPHNVNVVLHQSIFSDICTFRLYPFCTLSSICF